MTNNPPMDYVIESLDQDPVELINLGEGWAVEEVGFGTSLVLGEAVQQPEVVEVFSAPPVGGGYYRTEVLAFTKMGTLTVITGSSTAEFPIAGGQFLLSSIAARVVTPPTGGPIILDVLKDNASIFTNSADRPTIAAGANNAVTNLPANVMFADGDFVEVQIVQVGSTTPGTTLTASLRVTRIG